MSWIDNSPTIPTWNITGNVYPSRQLNRTIIQGFLDVSGGNIILRNGGLYTQSDISSNGNLYVSKSYISGNLAIGKTTAGFPLDVSGNAYISGGITIGASGAVTAPNFIENGTNLSSKYVDISSAQIITGSKVFTTATNISTAFKSSADSGSIDIIENLSAGAYNSIANVNDCGIIFGDNTGASPYLFNVSKGLVIAPHTYGPSGIKISATGNVGIGTASPAYPLDVSGNARISNNLYLNFNSSIGSSSGSRSEIVSFGNQSSAMFGVLNYYGYRNSTGSDFQSTSIGFEYKVDATTFWQGAYNRFGMGIGTASPAYPLDVSGNANIYGILYINSPTTIAQLFIGTNSTTTTAELYVGYSDSNTNSRIIFGKTNSYIQLYGGAFNYYNSNTAGHYFYAGGTAYCRIDTTGVTVSYRSITVGDNSGNAGVGINTLASNTGTNNTAFGYYALNANTTGLHNTAIGQDALRTNTTGYSNTAIGYATLFNNSIGINYNTAIGALSMFGATPSTPITGVNNTAVGIQSLYNITSGYSNTAIGFLSLQYLTTGSNNVAIGYTAGRNTAFTTGNNCTFLGGGTYAIDNYSNSTAVGYGAQITGNSQIVLGTTGERVYIPGGLDVNVNTTTLMSATRGTVTVFNGYATTTNLTTSSIVFPSSINYGSDYGYILYVPDSLSYNSGQYNIFSSASSECASLVIGCENDKDTGAGPDSVIISPAGYIVLYPNNGASSGITYITGKVGIGVKTPISTLDVNGSVSSLSIPGAYMLDSGGSGGSFPIFSSIANMVTVGLNDRDDYYYVMPGYKLVIYYDVNYNNSITTIDNTSGSTIIFQSISPVNNTSSCRLYYNNIERTISGLS